MNVHSFCRLFPIRMSRSTLAMGQTMLVSFTCSSGAMGSGSRLSWMIGYHAGTVNSSSVTPMTSKSFGALFLKRLMQSKVFYFISEKIFGVFCILLLCTLVNATSPVCMATSISSIYSIRGWFNMRALILLPIYWNILVSKLVIIKETWKISCVMIYH